MTIVYFVRYFVMDLKLLSVLLTTVFVLKTANGQDPPVFLSAFPTTYEILDTMGFSQSVATVAVYDADAGGTFSTLSMTPNSLFEFIDLGDSTGVVLTDDTNAISTGSGTTQTLTFVALDVTSQTATISYDIVILNTLPTLSDLPTSAQVSEDVSAEILVYNITCTDPFDTVSSSLVSVTPSNSPSSEFFFVQRIPSDTVYAVYARSQTDTSQGLFSYNSQRDYVLEIECTDTKDSVVGYLTVNLIQNEPPAITNIPSGTSISVASSTASGQTVFTVVASDNENDYISFVSTCNPTGCPFTVTNLNSTTALVETNVDLSTLTSASDLGYDMTITPLDTRNTGTSKILTILITGTNNAPTFTNLDNAVTVDENTAVGTTVFTITTSDADMDTLTLSFTSDPTSGTTYFDMDSAGVVTVLSALNYEALTNTTFVLTVLATDTKTTSTGTLSVIVTDVNEALTWNSANYQLDVSDGAVVGTTYTVTNLAVTDPDVNETLTCTMSCSPAGYFSMSTSCIITVTSVYSLDEGLANTVTCTVNGTDNGENTATTSLVIDIVDTNNYTPTFGEAGYVFTVSPYEVSGVTLGNVTATDADTGTFGQFSYSLDQTHLPAAYFTIGSSSGNVSTAVSMETCSCSGSTLAIPVYATDNGGLVGTSTVYITLTVTSTTTSTTTTERPITFIEDSNNTSWLALLIATGVVTAIVTGYVLLKYVFTGPGNICKNSVNKPFKSKSTKANKKTKASNSHGQREDVPQRREPEPEQGGNDFSPPKHQQRWRNEKFL